MSDETAPPYRDGMRALVESYEERLRRVAERAARIAPEARAELRPEHRCALDECARRLSQAAPSTMEELADAEGALDGCERLIDDATWLAGELRALRVAQRRRRVLAGKLAAVALAATASLIFLPGAYRSWTATRACRASDECRVHGRCRSAPDDRRRCVALDRDGCAASVDCIELGLCSPGYYDCFPETDDECRRSRGCAEEGRCRSNSDPMRKPPIRFECEASEEGCRAASACSREGRCTARYGRCVAGDDGRRDGGGRDP